jgi:holliday junction DNA helicase RuvA
MVDYFIGTVKNIQPQEIILESGLFGITLNVAQEHRFSLDTQVKIYSYMHWNQENGPCFFGFLDQLERAVFKIIISCSGIGPKIALAILTDLGSQNFLQIITSQDDQALSKVSGIGKKKAEQIVVQLKHKVATLLESGKIEVEAMQEISHFQDVSLALQSLNYSRQEITKAMEYVKKNAKKQTATFDMLLRQALSYLSKQI